uniref:UBR-type domain-containing protein n=1 Tax=Rhabditophanes sp. KR3021 TaxID=114890 RepID=A0AC35U1K7_9BILA
MEKESSNPPSEAGNETDTETCASSTVAITNMDDDTDRVMTLAEFMDFNRSEDLRVARLTAGSDPKICTYPEGYKARQLIFGCLTCRVNGGKDEPAGICFGCSLNCHKDHDVIEMYTKRGFQCDCGNSKFGDFKCELYAEKEPLNSRNKYGQNFEGKYCSCNQVYEGDVAMIQCVVCEDWYHFEHLLDENVSPPDEDSFEEMACNTCTQKLDFIKYYNKVENIEDDIIDKGTEKCRLERIKKYLTEQNNDTTEKVCFFKNTLWRQRLCDCLSCWSVYEEHKCHFLSETEDTISEFYRDADNITSEDIEEADIISELFSSSAVAYGRDAALNIVSEVSQIVTHVGNFLKRKHEENGGRVINKEDVKNMIEDLEVARKKIKEDNQNSET